MRFQIRICRCLASILILALKGAFVHAAHLRAIMGLNKTAFTPFLAIALDLPLVPLQESPT